MRQCDKWVTAGKNEVFKGVKYPMPKY